MKTNLAITTVLAVRELEDSGSYTTGTSALMRFPSDHREFIRVRRNIESMLRYRKVERHGDLRGRPTYLGADIKEVLFHEGGQWLSGVADRLLQSLWQLHETAGESESIPEEEYQKIFRKLKRAKGLVVILDALDEHAANPHAELLQNLSRWDLERLLYDFGEIEDEPCALAEPIAFPAQPTQIEEAPEIQEEETITQEPAAVVTVEEYPRPQKGRLIRLPRGRYTRFIAVAACFFLVLGGWATVETLGRARVILDTQGIGAALKYVAETRLDLSDGFKDRRDAVFIFFRGTQYDKAESLARSLLEEKDLSQKLRGDCYLILGHIYKATNRRTSAEAAYREADRLYTRPLYKNYSALGLGDIAWSRGNYEEALRQADRAAVYREEAGYGNHSGELILRGVVALGRGDLETALNMANQRLSIAKTERDKAHALSEKGLIHALRGEFPQAIQNTFDAEARADALGDEHMKTFNAINYVAMCTRQGAPPPEAVVQRIESFLALHDNQRLAWYYDLARKTSLF